MVRALQRSIFGRKAGASFCSISVQRMPRLPRSTASVSPTGPAPTIRTCVSAICSSIHVHWRQAALHSVMAPAMEAQPDVGSTTKQRCRIGNLRGRIFGIAKTVEPRLAWRSWTNPSARDRPPKMPSRRCLTIALAAAVSLAATFAHAQSYPSRPIRLVVPFAAGGAVDVLARLLGAKLADRVGQPVIVENRAAAGGTLAAADVAKAAPDGYTILQTTNGAALAPSLYASLPYAAIRDFSPVTQVVASNLILVASVKSGITSVRQLIDDAKAHPGKLNYGSSGVGNPLHLTMEMLKHATGIDIVAVPFRGNAQINTALIAGEVEVAIVPLATAAPLIQDGRIRGLAITGARRSPTVPDVPTVAEAGVPGFASTSWQGWFMPANAPAPIVVRIQQEIVKVLAMPDVQARLAAMAYEGVGSTPTEFAAYYREEIGKFARVVADANIPKQ